MVIDKNEKIYKELKKAIANDDKQGIKLVYQPKIDLENNDIKSWEILSRWSHPELGVIPPAEFIPIVIEEGKEYEFDMHILESTCKDISKLYKFKNTYSINMSVNTLQKKGIVNDILSITKKYNIKPKSITLEVLETSQVQDYNIISGVIKELEELGYGISIDDFGTGYSSYYRLSNMHFNEIKIPKEFLPENNENRDKQIKILKGIVHMAKSLDCKIVIEGVETLENHELAKRLGIDYGQGYLYAHPMSYNDYVNTIKTNKLVCKNKNYST